MTRCVSAALSAFLLGSGRSGNFQSSPATRAHSPPTAMPMRSSKKRSGHIAGGAQPRRCSTPARNRISATSPYGSLPCGSLRRVLPRGRDFNLASRMASTMTTIASVRPGLPGFPRPTLSVDYVTKIRAGDPVGVAEAYLRAGNQEGRCRTFHSTPMPKASSPPCGEKLQRPGPVSASPWLPRRVVEAHRRRDPS